MDREINVDSIRALDEQIRENGFEWATIKLKRMRNSLLNVSKLPPEVLGNIFSWNVTLKDDFDGLEKRSHNFLVVCHHWFEVATSTPGLWSFWGNTPEDWSRWYRRSGTAPLDLVLGSYNYDDNYFDVDLYDALRDRAAKDTIRRVHLAAGSAGLLRSIITSLIANPGELRSNNIVSFVLRNQSKIPFGIPDFFAHYRFPKLQRLDLSNCAISSWDHLPSRTSVLTTLRLEFGFTSLIPTTSQLLSILASNPALQEVGLLKFAIPTDGGGKSSSRVQLHHLKKLHLHGDLPHVLKFLPRLDHPRNIDHLLLTLQGCNLVDISQIVGPYLQDHLQRRDRTQSGLNLSVTSGYRTYRALHIALQVGDGRGIDFSNPAQAKMNVFMAITMILNGKPPSALRAGAILDLIACTPREEVVYIKARNYPVVAEDTYTRFPNLRAISFGYLPLATAFPTPNLVGDGKIFPSLEHVLLEGVSVDDDGDDDWKPLTTFLACRMSSGNRLDTLVITNHMSDMSQEVEGDVRAMVREFNLDVQSPES